MDATIGKSSVIGAGALFGDGTVIGERSVFGPGVTVGASSYIAGNQVLAGGDHFGAHTSFGPNIRFGPNTEFDGDELFAAGSSFGDSTKFDWAAAGKDTFGGGHSFGVSTHWGDNQPQVTSGGPIRPEGTGKAGVDQSVVVGLPPGYQPTSITGVYQYSAVSGMTQPQEQQRRADVDWTARQVHSGSPTGVEKYEAHAGPQLLRAAMKPQTLWGMATPALAAGARQEGVVRSLGHGEKWESSKWESSRVARAAAAAAAAAAQAGAAAGAAAARSQVSGAAAHGRKQHFGSGMAAWLSAHASHLKSPGPSSTLAAAATNRVHAKHRHANKGGPSTSSFNKLDGLHDHKVPVATVKDAKAKGISFFSMFD